MRNSKGQFVKGSQEIIDRNKSAKQRLAVSNAQKKIKNRTPWNKGKKRWNFGTKAGFQKGNKFAVLKTGMKFSKEQIDRLRKAHIGLQTGEKHPNWKGGVTLLAERIRKCFKNRQWKSDVFYRDNFTCQECGIRGGWIEAHHIKPFAIILQENKIKTLEQALECEELWNLNNGQTLCKKCHNLTKKKI